MDNYLSFGFFDSLAKPNSLPASEYKQDIVDMNDLKGNIEVTPKLVTFEKDVWKLDGSYSFYNEEKDLGYISSVLSDDECNLNPQPVVSITFDGVNVDTVGITFLFGSTGIPQDFNVKWYKDSILLHEEDVTGNKEKTVIIEYSVQSYNKVDITFKKTALPKRFVRLLNIGYGINKVFDENNITSGSFAYHDSVISNELQINTLEFTVYSETADFSILNPKGIYKMLKEKQRFDAFMSGENYGTFYLKNWTALDNNNYSFVCEDAIGLLEETDFDGGMYFNASARDVIESIFDGSGVKVEFDENAIAQARLVSGWIPISTRRSALANVLFASNLVAYTYKRDSVYITRVNTEKIGHVSIEDIYDGERVTLRALVTGVQITEHNFVKEDKETDIFNDTVKAGDVKIVFNEPYADVTASTGTIIKKNENYVLLRVDQEGVVNIKGKKYVDNKSVKAVTLAKAFKENIVKIEDVYLVNGANSDFVMNAVFGFYKKRIERNLSYDWKKLGMTGNVVGFETIFGETKDCLIEDIEVDILSNDAEITAVVMEDEDV